MLTSNHQRPTWSNAPETGSSGTPVGQQICKSVAKKQQVQPKVDVVVSPAYSSYPLHPYAPLLQYATSFYNKNNNLQRKVLLGHSFFDPSQTSASFVWLWWWIFPRRLPKCGAWLLLQYIYLFGINLLTCPDICNHSHTFLHKKLVGWIKEFYRIQVQIRV